MIFEYKGGIYPDYLKGGNAVQFITPMARHFCKGKGLDVGAGHWPFWEAQPVELRDGGDAMNLPEGEFDYLFSSHCLEHLQNPIAALRHWRDRLKTGGVLFLYLPHPDMEYWRPENCAKHLHEWQPAQMARIVREIGFTNVLHSERDLAWGFAVVGFKA